MDANANELPAKEEADDERPPVEGALGSTALAALTDLCGRTVLSPAFFLGSDAAATAPSDPIQDVSVVSGGEGKPAQPKPKLWLKSHKMAGLKDLLLAEKLNTHAISLQLTAQSQVQLGGRGKGRDQDSKDVKQSPADGANPTRPKRSRKEF